MIAGYYRSSILPPGIYVSNHITIYIQFYTHRRLANEGLDNFTGMRSLRFFRYANTVRHCQRTRYIFSTIQRAPNMAPGGPKNSANIGCKSLEYLMYINLLVLSSDAA